MDVSHSAAMPLLPIDPGHLSRGHEIREALVDVELSRVFPQRGVQRILFVAPPDSHAERFVFSTAKRGTYHNYPPYGVGVIATHLRRDNIAVAILNLNSEVLKACAASTTEDDFVFATVVRESLTRVINEFKPDLIGVTCMFAITHKSAQDTCAEISHIAPNVPVVVGGVHITNHLAQDSTREALIRDFPTASFMFLYEAELGFRNFIRTINRKASAQDLSQVIFTQTNPVIYYTNRRLPQEGEDLDVVPAHDLMSPRDMAQNGKIGGFYALKKPGTLFTTILSNRGCRAKCTFCSVRSINGPGVRMRSVQSVIDELLMLRQEYGVGHVMWLDDDILYDGKRALQLFNEMVRQEVGITWDCSNGVIAASCVEELMLAAAESGCIGVCVGVESGNPKRLRQILKPGTVDTFLKAAEVIRKIDRIHSRTLLMTGFPGETYRETMDTIRVAQEMDLDWNNVNILQPLPNTPIFDQMVADGLITGEVEEILDDQNLLNNSRAYGKLRKKNRVAGSVTDLLALDFKDAFAAADLDNVPSRRALDDIWAYMNFHLNFKRLLKEKRPAKILQQTKYLRNIAEISAPESAFAMYFYGYLSRSLTGRTDSSIILRLEGRLAASQYWRDRIRDFGLSPDDLRLDIEPLFAGVGAGEKWTLEDGWLPESLCREELATSRSLAQSTR